MTALMLVAEKNELTITRLLLDYRANLQLTDKVCTSIQRTFFLHFNILSSIISLSIISLSIIDAIYLCSKVEGHGIAGVMLFEKCSVL